MQIKFVGAIGRVTGSCTWLKYERTGSEFLVDCGMVQGEENNEYENKKSFPFEPRDIKFILLTHAHLDHCGLIPRLYKEGFCGKVYCTSATANLSKIILLDAATQSKGLYSTQNVEQIKFHKVDDDPEFKWGKSMWLEDAYLQYYFLRSAHILGSAAIGILWEEDNCPQNSILFSGDLGNNIECNAEQTLLKYRQQPFRNTKNIVLESTYGNAIQDPIHTSFENRITQLEQEIIHTIGNKRGQLIIPAFSLHRTQEIMMDLYYLFAVRWKNKPAKSYQSLRKKVSQDVFVEYLESIEGMDTDKDDLYTFDSDNKSYILKQKYQKHYQDRQFLMHMPVHVKLDSAMAKDISRIYAKEMCRTIYSPKDKIDKYHNRNENLNKWLSLNDQELDKLFKNLYHEDSFKIGAHSFAYSNKAFSLDTPYIIITSSGMCDQGNVLKHLARTLPHGNNTILLTGYQAESSNGRLLSKLDDMTKEDKQNAYLKLEKNEKLVCSNIKAEIHTIKGYSGHADQKSLLEYLFTNTGTRHYAIPVVFLNHGSNTSRHALKNAIEAKRSDLCTESKIPEYFQTNIVWTSNQSGIYDLEKQLWINNTSSYPSSDMMQELGEIKMMLQNIMTRLGMSNLCSRDCI